MSYAETARNLFLDGYGCAQAVFTAFSPLTGVEKEQALRISIGLGGGVGRMREVCGTVSGAAMVLGALYGGDGARDKTAAYAKVRQFADAFKAIHGAVVCRELLQKKKDEPEPPQASDRDAQFYATRPCARLVFDAAKIIEMMLREDGILKNEELRIES